MKWSDNKTPIMIEVLPARIPEEPGAVIPHAGICEGASSYRRPYLNRQESITMSNRSYTISLLLILGVFYGTVFGQAGMFHPLLLVAFLSPLFDDWITPKAICLLLLFLIVIPFFSRNLTCG